MDVGLASINIQSELERIGWDYEFAGDDEVKCRCPAHDDARASASISLTAKLWKCHAAGCSAKGDFITFLALALKGTRRVVIEELSTRYDFAEIKVIDSATIERYHLGIWKDANAPLIKQLYLRGVNDESIRKYRLGVHNKRITIPVLNDNGYCINIRRYLPGAPGSEKMRNARGHGKVRLYPVAQVKFETVVICGGEVKAIATAQRMNPLGIGAVCATAGEGSWAPEFSKRLSGKRIFVCMDIDKGGLAAADKICARVRNEVDWIGKVELPLDIDKYPHGDINDYFGPEQKTADDFQQLLDSTSIWQPPNIEADVDDSPALPVSLSHSTLAKHAGIRLAVKGVITAMDTTPYLVPQKVECNCSRDQEFCINCPVYGHTPDDNGLVEMTLNCESPAILEMVNAPKRMQADVLRQGLRIPPCKVVTFKTLTHYNVEDLRISPQLEIGSQQSEQVMIPALSISHGLEMNVGYQFEGRTHPNPKTQQAVLLLSKSKPSDDSLLRHEPSDTELEELALFQPEEWTVEGLTKKLNAVYSDFEANVTRIFKRRDLHLAIDLAYHSALLFRFDKRTTKGWTEVLVVGDSSQGKTETSKCLMEHYGLGEKVECKNATVAGLLGGVQQLGGRWFVTWGMIPTHDRRLIILEELKGASTEVISKLTDMRSSGVAEIPKIEKRRTHARTRLLALSNPRSDLPMSAYNFGVDAVKELIGSPEDLRRFDYCLCLSNSEIDPKELNKLSKHRPHVKHVHTDILCRRCILWAWTRTENQVEFTEIATEKILESANMLCEKYTEVVPIVDRGSIRLKLARLAVALAGRTFSTGPSPQILVVRPCHVDYIVQFLDRTYSSPVFGYADYSRAYKSTRELTDIAGIRRRVLSTPFARDFIEQILYCNDIELRDICDWCAWERGAAIEFLSYLVRKHALYRSTRAYRKNPQFIKLLKQLQGSKELDIVDRPAHVQESEDEF